MKAAEERKHKRDERSLRGPGEDYGDLLESVSVPPPPDHERAEEIQREKTKTQQGQGCICTGRLGGGGEINVQITIPRRIGGTTARKRCAEIKQRKIVLKKEPQPSEMRFKEHVS